jgi:hypothetical protein
LRTLTAAQLLQRPRDEAIGKRLCDEVPELRGSIIEDMLRQVFDKHVAVHFEYLDPLSNRWFVVHGHPYNGGSVFQGLLRSKIGGIAPPRNAR